MDPKLIAAMEFIQEFLPLMEKYEAALIQIKADPLCPNNLREHAKKALDFGMEVMDS